MMTISDSIDHYIQSIKSNPMDFDARLALVQFYCLAGNWDKALKTIEQYLKLNEKDNNANILFKNNIECELIRLNTLNHKIEINTYVSIDIDSSRKEIFLSDIKQQDYEEIKNNYINIADQLNKDFTVQLNNETQCTGTWLDTDFRFTDLVEVFIHNQYYLIPMYKIVELKFKSNEFLTDIMWRRADIILDDSRNTSCFIPTRYPFLFDDNLSDDVKWGRQTTWVELGDLSMGMGQKTITNGEQDVGWLDISLIQVQK